MPRKHHAATLVVIGGGLGGVATALTAARLGQRVILTERGDWLGGQLSTQGVPPDEHQWIETEQISPSYSELRTRIRDHYRTNYPLSDTAVSAVNLNPGNGFVSRLCHEPRVAAHTIEEMLSPLVASGLLTILKHSEPIELERVGPRVQAVVVRDRRDGSETRLEARFFADATELGDLLPLGNLDHVIGAEASSETGELHAPPVANPFDQQAVTWCAALEYRAGEDHVIDPPTDYGYWRSTVAPFWPGSQLSWDDVDPVSLERRTRPMFATTPAEAETSLQPDLWHYRRILSRYAMGPGWPSGDVTLMNWPQADYWERPLAGVSDAAQQDALDGARALTLSFVYWMQTEAPRSDGGIGYPELHLRGDVLGTVDGLAKEAYIRESRRIRAHFTITEEHIGREMRESRPWSESFADSVGIGFYRIDLHPSAFRSYIDIDCFPFQIPLGALLPRDVGNLFAAGKNIGTTHITNGAYRLHPVEWSIGEAVGALAGFCATEQVSPEEVRSKPGLLQDYQSLLRNRLGIALEWPESVRTQGRDLVG
ncbi:hypothetical protein JOF29_007057 [Kribbella aluminosa]|uniref:FAD dependent oxidoreductase n=1 Tax=Kribbella aluminosa TaxID=416017 RepID=A0ABS4UWB4_9ACTN|nr:FAD-dependent oxidoreductase [Kribbella aluminosa]MBP2355947.1 hypothetical protein [Kribbella aluminosa]